MVRYTSDFQTALSIAAKTHWNSTRKFPSLLSNQEPLTRISVNPWLRMGFYLSRRQFILRPSTAQAWGASYVTHVPHSTAGISLRLAVCPENPLRQAPTGNIEAKTKIGNIAFAQIKNKKAACHAGRLCAWGVKKMHVPYFHAHLCDNTTVSSSCNKKQSTLIYFLCIW